MGSWVARGAEASGLAGPVEEAADRGSPLMTWSLGLRVAVEERFSPTRLPTLLLAVWSGRVP